MSAMRNAVQRRNHKERAQPLERQKWGLLEKHKDYSLRAKDYGQKKKQLKRLREKAADRNPDEFHFAMINSRTQNGGQRVAERGAKALSTDAVKLLKTQDAGYLRVAAQKTRNDRVKLEQVYNLSFSEDASQNLCLLRGRLSAPNRGRVVFVDRMEAQANHAILGENITSLELDDEEDIVERVIPGYKLGAADHTKRALLKKRKRQEDTRAKKLMELDRQEKDITAAQRELSLQRARMNSAIGGITKAGVKWKVRERKR